MRSMTMRLVALFALVSLLAVGLISTSVLWLDHEARRTRAAEAAARDLDLIVAKLKGALDDPQAGPLVAGMIRDVDAYAGAATGRSLRFDPAQRGPARAEPRTVSITENRVERAGAALATPAGELTVTRAVEASGPLRPALIRYGGLASLLAVLLAALAGFLVSRSLTRRAGAMNAVFAAAAAGTTTQRVDTDGPLEFRTLAGNLNRMLDVLDQRLTALRLSSDRLAHDLRTPLTRIAARLATIESSDDPTARESATVARTEIARLVSTLNAMLDLREIETDSRLDREPFRLDVAIREAIDLYEAEAEDVHGVTIRHDLPAVEMTGSEPLVVRAVANLIDNALHAAPRGSTVAVTAAVAEAIVTVEVRDAGPGLPPALNAELVNEDMLRSRWNGHGLGLTIVRAIARRHGGSVTLLRRDAETVARLELALT